MAKTLPKVDLSKMSAAEIDKLSHTALKEAVRSVVRDPNIAASHKDHRSHSSVAEQVINEKINPAINPAINAGKVGGPGR